MAPSITAFGYRVPVVVVLVFIALVLGLALAVAFYLTIGWSVYRSVQSTRKERARERLEEGFLVRLFDHDRSWAEWVAGMSDTEREVVEAMLEEYLWELDGSNAARLRVLAEELGVPDRECRQLLDGSQYDRLHALTWLTMLERPDLYRESGFVPQTPRERAAVARLLMTDETATATELVDLLLSEAAAPFSVFGLDTLYRATRDQPEVFLTVAAREYRTWPDQLQVQMLTVCQQLDIGFHEEGLPWLTATLEADDEAVRAASARALGSFRWHEPLRDRVFLTRAIGDPSPRVRGAVYEMFASWGDDAALDVLLFALVSEDHPQALVRGTDALVEFRDRIDDRVAAVAGDSWTWSLAHARCDRIARNRAPAVHG